MNTKLPARLDKILAIASRIRADRILDIGCGDGRFTTLLGNTVHATGLFGMEMNPSAVAIANTSNICAEETDLNGCPFPFPNSYFGLIFAGEIVEHLVTPDLFLSEVHRTLEPSGTAIFTVPNISSWHCRIQLMLGYQPYAIPLITKHRWVGAMLAERRSKEDYTKEHMTVNAKSGLDHVQFHTCRGFCDLLKAHRFNVVKVLGTTTDEFTVNLPDPIKKIVKWLDGNMTKIPSLASGIIVVTDK